MKLNLEVREISKDDALGMIQEFHYSNTLPKLNKHFLGFFQDGKMVGCLTLGWGTRPAHTIKRIFPSLTTDNYFEIGRMCMTEDMPRNSETQMLSACCHWIKANCPTVKVLFTWADGMVGKPGYVYQAASFIYAGYSGGEMYMKDGKKIHVRQMKAFLAPGDKRITVRPTVEQMREYGIEHYRGKQFRYFKFLCGKHEKRRLLKECLLDLTEPNPKEDDLTWTKRDLTTGKWVKCDKPPYTTDVTTKDRNLIRGEDAMLIFYDFEVFKHDWLVVLIEPSERKETVIINDPKQFKEFYETHKDHIWIGYNSRNYDQWIAKGILCEFDPKEVNDWIIVKDRKGWEFSDLMRNYPINNFDVMTSFHGLKQLEAFMGNDIRETSVPFDIDRKLTDAEIQETVKYCRHDVEQTIEVFLQRKNEFDSQVSLLKTFKLPLNYIGKTQAQLAAIILGARKKELFDEWDIRLPDTLQLSKYRHIADWFMADENHDADKWIETDVAGVPHVFAWGGVHGAISTYNYTCKPDEIMVMADVDQLYPSLMVYYNLLSRGVSEPERFKVILDTSLRLKAEKKKKEREPYKRICNITYGAMGDKFNPMYDPLHRNLVCVFGQVLLLDLIEKIEPFTELIQSNTDGILIKLKREDFDRLDDAVFDWEQRTHLHMSFDCYKTVYQGDVNNYLVIDYEGHSKSKGAYVKSLGDLDNDLPIVNQAITAYLTSGIHPRETVMECDDLIAFQKVVKVSSKYAYGTLNGRRMSDKTFRVFASKRTDDGIIGKVKTEGANIEKFANTPERCFIWNQSVKDVKVPDYLDREWYIDLAIKRIKDKFGIEV